MGVRGWADVKAAGQTVSGKDGFHHRLGPGVGSTSVNASRANEVVDDWLERQTRQLPATGGACGRCERAVIHAIGGVFKTDLVKVWRGTDELPVNFCPNVIDL